MGVSPMISNGSFDNAESKGLPNPNPNNYKIIRSKEMYGNLVVEIQYLDCTNYEGFKILVFEKCDINKLTLQKHIDPHFSENKNFYSPVARFEPTKKGWELACYVGTCL